MGMFDQMKQAMQMRKEAKKLQSEIEKISYTHQNGGISCTVKGDFTVSQIKLSDEALTEVKAGKTERFETMLRTVINAAVTQVKQQNQQMMQQMMKDNDSLPFAK
ncbi:MAG: YbaB/EbfC family nucleoid-associated protein [Kiritimatiellia bacterium]